jgi:hypothetical protein
LKVPPFAAFSSESASKRAARVSRAEKEAKEAEKLLAEITNKTFKGLSVPFLIHQHSINVFLCFLFNPFELGT